MNAGTTKSLTPRVKRVERALTGKEPTFDDYIRIAIKIKRKRKNSRTSFVKS